MELPIPSWFKYRQGEAKSAGENCYELTAPQMDPAYIRIRKTESGWQASVARTADGEDVAASRPDIPNEREAWSAAFELYRGVEII